MSGKVLLFGFDDLPAILALSAAAESFGAEVIPVARGDYNKPIAVLAGLDTALSTAQPYAGGPLGGRMLVLCGMDGQISALLPVLNQAGAGPECLKAVLTPNNRVWDAVTLYEELWRERRALQGKQP